MLPLMSVSSVIIRKLFGSILQSHETAAWHDLIVSLMTSQCGLFGADP